MLNTAHLPYPKATNEFTISAAHMARLVEQCSYVPQGDLILFGIRSGMVSNGIYGIWSKEIPLTEVSPDYTSLRCLIGIWNVKTHQLAVFPASTYPHLSWIEKQQQAPSERICNMHALGAYHYIIGAHEPIGREKEEGAFRLSRLQPVGVWRLLAANTNYTLEEATFDLSVTDNHIHSAQSEHQITGLSYTSAGCQVVAGDHLAPAMPTGHYQQFRILSGQAAMPSNDDIGKSYTYLLTHARELYAISKGFNEARLLHGSKGYLVRAMQEALIKKSYLKGHLIDKGYFNGHTAMALHHYQCDNPKILPNAIANKKTLNKLGIQ